MCGSAHNPSRPLGRASSRDAPLHPLRSILADDLENDYKQDRLSLMPNLRTRLRDVGAHFPNHVAAQPVCGPSRSSFLSGRFPHNVGYVNNGDKASRTRYLQEQVSGCPQQEKPIGRNHCDTHPFPLQNNSIGTWLTAEGYHTAFLGKVRLRVSALRAACAIAVACCGEAPSGGGAHP